MREITFGLSSMKVENKAIGNILASIMGITQVHNKMNLVYDKLKAVYTTVYTTGS